jgi:ribonuclease-3
MTIAPSANFTVREPTVILYDNNEYSFEGFSIFSHEPIIDHLPDCVVVIYNQEYKLNVVKEDFVENFTVKEIDLLKKFLFRELLELYDLKWKGHNVGSDGCNRFHVMPRFCRSLPCKFDLSSIVF